ncbi:MAG: EAL domain-containing response regulator [Pseudomonadota bacterium]
MRNWGACTALVVEDSQVQRDHMTGLLRQAGFGVVLQACDGIDALRQLDARGMPVELVLTDLDMPGMDGIELMHHLGELELASNLVVASARDTRLREAVASMRDGAARPRLLGAALKPLHFDVLTTILDRAAAAAQGDAALPQLMPAQFEAALACGQIVPYFEPRIEISSGLLRSLDVQPCWQHPERGLLRAGRFTPALDGSALMASLVLLTATQALRQLHAWHDIGLVSLTVSLKLPAALAADRGLIDRLSALVHEHGVAPRQVIWEVGASVLAGGNPISIANLAHLSLRGFGLGLDGYRADQTTLQHLSRCPLTGLRLERVLVHEASRHPGRQLLLQQAIDAAHRLGIAVLAEGLELADDWALLRALGCEQAQGALVAPPMPAAALVGWIKGNRRRLKELAAGSGWVASAKAPPGAMST